MVLTLEMSIGIYIGLKTKENTMKIIEIQKSLQAILDSYDWHTVKTHQQFHTVVREILLASIPAGLRLSLWDISFGEYHDDKVFTYNRDFVKDARTKYTDRGIFSNVKIEVAEKNLINLELKDAEAFFTEKHRQERVEYLTGHIATLKKQLAQSEKELAQDYLIR